ncbi:MAG: hypothetical protein NVS4B10_19150 [Myxococcales bacterium]
MANVAAGNVVLVVGAAGGIGTALCHRLAARGARLILAGRDEDRLRALSSLLGGEVAPVDARDFDAVGRIVAATFERHGRIDGAVNLAGSILLKPAHTTSAQEWDDVVSTNLRTAFALVRAVVPRWTERAAARSCSCPRRRLESASPTTTPSRQRRRVSSG